MGREHRSGQRIRQHQKKTARQQSGRKKKTVIRPPHHPAGMRHDQADKTDIAGSGNGCRRQKRPTGKQPLFEPGNIDPQRPGHIRMQRQQVDCRRNAPDRNENRDDDQNEPGIERRSRQIAHQPENHSPQVMIGRDRQQQRHHRTASECQNDTRQKQP